MAKKPAKTPEPAPKVRRFKGVKESTPATINPPTTGVLIEGTPENSDNRSMEEMLRMAQTVLNLDRQRTEEMREFNRNLQNLPPVVVGIPKPGDVYEPAVAEGDVHAGDPVVAGRKTGHVKAFHPLKKRLPKGTEIRLVMGDGRWIGWLQPPPYGLEETPGPRIEADNPSLARTVKALLDTYNRANGTTIADEDKL